MKRKETTFLIFLCLFSCTDILAQAMEVILNGKKYELEEFTVFDKALDEVTLLKLGSRSGESRIYTDSNDRITVEYFNRRFLRFKSANEYQELGKVDFMTLSLPRELDFFTYMYEVTETEFNSIRIKDSSEFLQIDGLEDRFYKLSDGRVLMEGKEYWAAEKYYVLKGLETLVAIDSEYQSVLEDHISLPGYDIVAHHDEINAQPVDFELEIKNRREVNYEEAKKRISEDLNIAAELLDYSKESLTIIDESLSWNNQNVSQYRLLQPCLAYVVKCLLNSDENLNVSWGDKNNVYVTDNRGNRSDIGAYAQWMIIDADHGPSVSPIFGQYPKKRVSKNGGLRPEL